MPLCITFVPQNVKAFPTSLAPVRRKPAQSTANRSWLATARITSTKGGSTRKTNPTTLSQRGMNKELQGRIALISGASRGIGRAIAVALAREGADVILCARGLDKLKEAQEEINAAGNGTAHVFALDATKADEIKKLFSGVVAKFGKLDILVNNVGGATEHETFVELTDDHWRRAFEFNFMPAVIFSREALPYLKQSSNARIVNISSVASKQPGGFNPHYGVAKAALNHLTKVLANNFAADQILVNTICPTTVLGGVWEDHVADKARRLGVSVPEAERLMEEEVRKKTPTGKIPTLQDVAELALFLASPRAKSITGTCIPIDGGYLKSVY